MSVFKSHLNANFQIFIHTQNMNLRGGRKKEIDLEKWIIQNR